jgi:hypothetical protein
MPGAVWHFTISTGLPRRNPAIIISSGSGGRARMAENIGK